MQKADTLIAIIPSTQFKWTAQIQYFESLPTRDEAILYASQHSCNLIVEYERRSGPKFDALQDPNLVCTSDVSGELVERVPVLIEPASSARSKRMLRGVFGLANRLAAVAGTSHRENVVNPVQG